MLVFMDYANGGSIEALGQKRTLSELEVYLVVKKMITCLERLAHHNIIHRDLSTNNILIHFPRLEKFKDLNEL
jgi:serine/threonine protein kinase